MKKHPFKIDPHDDLSIMVEQDRTDEYVTDPTADTVLRGLRKKISEDLLDYLYGMLQGFNDEMQLTMADDLLDFTTDKVVHLTGFPSVDTVLVECYNLIAEEKGIKGKDISYIME